MTRPPDPADNATHPGPGEALMAPAADDEHAQASVGGTPPLQPPAPHRPQGTKTSAGAALSALTRAETHALQRSQPLKPSLVNPPVDDRWRRRRPQPRHERGKQPPIWGGL
jgi:hypothetical protein